MVWSKTILQKTIFWNIFMAYPSPVLLFIAPLLVAMSSVALRILPNHNLPDVTNNNVRQPAVKIPGVVKCFVPPLNCPGTPNPVPGVNVNVILTCNEDRTVIADAVTDTSGFFQFIVDSSSTILSGASNTAYCTAGLRIPIAGCGVFLPKGVLDDPLGAVKTITDELFDHDVDQPLPTAEICSVNFGSDQSTVHDDHVVSSDQSSNDTSTLHEDRHIADTGKSTYYNDHSTLQQNIHT
ncbi:hypothetical protein TorRG33x02_144650 [Trema orientale]|uniref:Pollen Ole e 1 allergen and extensin family protein n=1 Tax=Trema orientale TaxID=63057 RepID=A0A2P5EW93_TREOI|nr:hypothetical protein TorRG33x02_144650 [Trema orientale]